MKPELRTFILEKLNNTNAPDLDMLEMFAWGAEAAFAEVERRAQGSQGIRGIGLSWDEIVGQVVRELQQEWFD